MIPKIGGRWSTFLKVSVAAVLLVLVASGVDWGNFVETIADANAEWLLAVLGVNLCDRVFMAAKWQYLLGGLGVKIRFLTALTHYFRGGLIGKAVQWGIGGDIARTAGVSRETGQSGPVVLSVVVEKLIGLAALGSLAVLSLLLLNVRVGIQYFYYILSLSGILLVIINILPFLFFKESATDYLRRLVEYFPAKFIKRRICNWEDIQEYWHIDAKVLAIFYVLTTFEQLVSTVNLLLLGEAFGVEVTLLGALSVMPIVSFFSRLPISVHSLGVREGLYVFMLGFLGIGSAEAFAMALTVRVLDILVIGSGALVTAPLRRKKEAGMTPEYSTQARPVKE